MNKQRVSCGLASHLSAALINISCLPSSNAEYIKVCVPVCVQEIPELRGENWEEKKYATAKLSMLLIKISYVDNQHRS